MSIFVNRCTPPAYLQVFGEDAQSYLQSQLSVDLVSMEPDDIRLVCGWIKKEKPLQVCM